MMMNQILDNSLSSPKTIFFFFFVSAGQVPRHLPISRQIRKPQMSKSG
uniref:Uncharacterized protein n=1 Tax=Rhizophora mucronata TaxID=61149 RepID=A0A2P2M966_RHIMU